MSRSGRPDPSGEPGVPWRALVFGALALILGAVVLANIVGVVYGLISPPDAPVPPDVVQQRYFSDAYGHDEWTFGVPAQPCEVIAFYQAQGGTCEMSPFACPVSGPQMLLPGQNMAVCRGEIPFSAFRMRWQAVINPGSLTDGLLTNLQLTRDVWWGG